ncbi:hypothetical protein F7725_026392 [Dissostichus mawsoni]|uniref:Ferritin n=1 Tax=Dissostichus mawsoni TaxID=36200 RepID=A0A7J5X7U2_DISMA|nr:hypothetical protein F7725_026392 [Dissostichus mawsoni]
MSSQVRQNFHQDCEAAINRQINLELYASYVYMSMGYFFDRDDQALNNFSKFFRHQSEEEREHAEKLMKLQNQRGEGSSSRMSRDEWGSGVEALECALQLEKNVNQSLLDLHKLCSDHNDPHLCDFIETHYLDEQVKSIKELGDWVTNLRRMGLLRTAWPSICSTNTPWAKRAPKSLQITFDSFPYIYLYLAFNRFSKYEAICMLLASLTSHITCSQSCELFHSKPAFVSCTLCCRLKLHLHFVFSVFLQAAFNQTK